MVQEMKFNLDDEVTIISEERTKASMSRNDIPSALGWRTRHVGQKGHIEGRDIDNLWNVYYEGSWFYLVRTCFGPCWWHEDDLAPTKLEVPGVGQINLKLK